MAGSARPAAEEPPIRIYLAASADELEALAGGSPVLAPAFVPASEQEEDELAALEEAAESGPVVVAADVDDPDEPVTITQVASFHVDLDGSGDLAWYATQEIADVLRAVRD